MLYFNRFDVSEGIDANRMIVSKQCNICHYWYFFKGLSFNGMSVMGIKMY